MIHIYRATRGGYSKPVPMNEAGLNFVDDEGNKATMPDKLRCEHSKHWEWGKGTRNGQKLWFNTADMFVQKWHLTKKQLNEAIKQYDMASLEMPTIIICKDCASMQNKPPQP